MSARVAPWLLLAAAGCAVGPDYEEPTPSVPGAWKGVEAGPELTSRARAQAADLSEWWKAFKDPALGGLVERALEANLELRAAASRVREARAVRALATGALLPEVDVRGGYEKQRWSENGFFPSDGKSFDYYQAGFDARWEIDVFGGTRRQIEAADADLGAALESLRDARVSLLAELARNYVEFRGLGARLRLARQNVEAQKGSAELTRARFNAGQVTDLDVARADALVAGTTSRIPALEAAARRSLHGLALLLGREPAALYQEMAPELPIPAAPPEIPVGLPTDLLRRRPDLRRAERQLAAATARVGVATADLYPRFFLTGRFGLESMETSDFLEAASRAWGFGPSIRWPLFQGGRIRANIEVQNARQEQAALEFERTLLAALRDVEDALVSHAREQARRAELAKAVAAESRAVELAQQRYREGLVDFLIVLEAQRTLYAAQDALVESDQAVTTFAIALYKALGGGWPAP